MGPPRPEEPRSDTVRSAAPISEARRERLAQARESLTTLDRTGQRARRKLQDAMAILARAVDSEASGKVAQVRRGYERDLAESRLDELPGDLIGELCRVEQDLFDMLSQRIATLVDEIRSQLGESGVELGFDASTRDRTSIEADLPDPGTKRIDFRDLLVVGPLLAVVGIVAMNPILIAGGAGAALIRGTQVFDRSRKDRARKQLADVSSDFRRQLSLALHQATIEARSSLTDALDDALGSRRDDLLEEIRALEIQRTTRRLPHRNARLRDRC